MEEQDVYLQYVNEKISKYERQLKGVLFHLNRHKELSRRLKGNVDLPKQVYAKPVQLNLFGT
jgi:hypothetical protein